MNGLNDIDPRRLEAIAFVGEALAPFFLEDPAKGKAAGASYAAFAGLNASEAAQEWPFGEDEPVSLGLAKMVSGLADGVTEELVWEYRRLFVGPGPKAAAPWGSVYTDHDGVMFGASALDLLDWMRANGIKRHADDGDPEDHIGLLLAMMAWISRHRPDLLCDFLRLHVLTWSSHYLALLEQRAQHDFFVGLAVLTRASLEGVQDQLGIEVDYPHFFR